MRRQQDVCWCSGFGRTPHEAQICLRSTLCFRFKRKYSCYSFFFPAFSQMKRNVFFFKSQISGSDKMNLFFWRVRNWQDAQVFIFKEAQFLILQATDSIFLYAKDVFFKLWPNPMLRTRGRGLSLVRASGGLEIGEQFVHMCMCPCGSTCVYVCGGCRARDARIKKRLVEIKALP